MCVFYFHPFTIPRIQTALPGDSISCRRTQWLQKNSCNSSCHTGSQSSCNDGAESQGHDFIPPLRDHGPQTAYHDSQAAGIGKSAIRIPGVPFQISTTRVRAPAAVPWRRLRVSGKFSPCFHSLQQLQLQRQRDPKDSASYLLLLQRTNLTQKTSSHNHHIPASITTQKMFSSPETFQRIQRFHLEPECARFARITT